MSTTHVNAARATKSGDRPTCWDCRQAVEIGQGYTWHQADRFSAKICWHDGCKTPRPSMLEGNYKRAAAMEAFEDAYDQVGSLRECEDIEPSDIDDLIDTLSTALYEVAEMYRETASNIEDGFQHATWQSDEQNEFAEQIESAASDLESYSTDLDDQDSTWRELFEDHGDAANVTDTPEAREEYADEYAELRRAKIEEALDDLDSMICDAEGNMP